MRFTTKSSGGTSFHGTTFTATVAELRKVLGIPADNNSGRDKVNFEWKKQTETGSVFTVYDWKTYRPLKEDELVNWHIGAHSKRTSQEALCEIEMALPIIAD